VSKYCLFGPQAHADNLGRLVGSLSILFQWLYVVLVVHGLSSIIPASKRGNYNRRCGIQSWLAKHSRQANWVWLLTQ
jgi:hypothetical protein